jgi:hypothetical protein
MALRGHRCPAVFWAKPPIDFHPRHAVPTGAGTLGSAKNKAPAELGGTEIIFAIGLLIGFALGYAVRAFISPQHGDAG